MLVRKKIDLEKSKDVIARLNEIPNPVLSARQFITANFDALQQSGKSLEDLHSFLLSNGINVGQFRYFRAVYNRIEHDRERDQEGEMRRSNNE